jgi:hypothetical protein
VGSGCLHRANGKRYEVGVRDASGIGVSTSS